MRGPIAWRHFDVTPWPGRLGPMTPEPQQGIVIRRATAADLTSLSMVDDAVTPGSERAALLGELVAGRGRCLVAEDAGAVVGYVAVAGRHFFGRDFVELLVVALDARRRGVGRALLRAAVEEAATEDVFTSTNQSNEPMRALLASEGWRLSGTLDGLDEGDPELVYLLAADAAGRGPASPDELVAAYLRAVEQADVPAIVGLFADDGVVHSPLYGTLPAAEFYPRLFADTGSSRLTHKATLTGVDVQGRRTVAFWFHFNWTLPSGTPAPFDVVDVATLRPDGAIAELHLVYDTVDVRPAFNAETKTETETHP